MTDRSLSAPQVEVAEHPIEPLVRDRILATLTEIEQTHAVRILLACESGSRGWGFASPDSDYDVRFLYTQRLEWYLQVLPQRDVIELPIDSVYDVNGWELRKALGLLAKGNATLVEWLDSPVIYRADPIFLAAIRELAQRTHHPARSFHHYLHMARGNFREYLRGESVRLKKYLYVLRPTLGAIWIERQLGPVPMRFQSLVDGVIEDAPLREEIAALLAIKRRAGEKKMGAPCPGINTFLERELARLSSVQPPAERSVEMAPFDQLLRETLLSAER